MKVLPIFKGYTVDERLREFRKVPFDALPEFVEFASAEGQQLLQEMREQGLSTAPVAADSPQGRGYLRQMDEDLRASMARAEQG